MTTHPFPLKHSQPQQRSQQADLLNRSSSCVLRVPRIQSRDHRRNTLNAYERLQSPNDAAPARIAAREALGPEERLVEAQAAHYGPEHAIELVVGFKAPCEVLQEGLELEGRYYGGWGARRGEEASREGRQGKQRGGQFRGTDGATVSNEMVSVLLWCSGARGRLALLAEETSLVPAGSAQYS